MAVPEPPDAQIARVLSHPLRPRILQILSARGEASPNEIASELGVPLGTLSYHTRLLRDAGSVRITGSGTLELAYVAAGRLHGWIQPAAFSWDWIPGALLVAESGGLATRTGAGPDWCIAARDRALHDALSALLTR